MDSSPSKRRKTSPTTSVPIDAPTTPSRIPGERYPSFASPTKASLSRHNPQLLRRPVSSGTGAEISGSQGNPFVASGEQLSLGQNSQAGGDGVQQAGSLQPSIEDDNDSALRKARAVSQPLGSRNPQTRVGGGFSTKPRRSLSKSPAKRRERTEVAVPVVDEDFNPFQKRGLRRSPQGSSQAEQDAGAEIAETTTNFAEISNPFRKTGLRRSPISSQAVESRESQTFTDVREDERQDQRREERQDGLASEQQNSNSNGQVEKRRSPRLSETTNSTNGTEFIREERSETVVIEQPRPAITPSPDVDEPIQEAIEETLPEEPSISPTPISRPPRPVASQAVSSVLDANGVSRIQEEPELPLTPRQRGLADPVVTTPPSGIHNTPSKRARRNKKLAEKLKSSPLKPQSERPVEPAEAVRHESYPANRRRRSARFFVPEDPNAEKKKARDELLKELEQLKADVAIANQENERIRLQYKSRKPVSAKPENPEELLAVLLRSTIPDRLPESETEPRSCVYNIGSFLPFSSRRKKSQPVALPDLEKPTPSHLPITLDDPLPYLQAFTPLTFTSNITLIPATPQSPEGDEMIVSARPIMQRHHVTARSDSGLFAAHLDMTVDTTTLAVSSIEIQKLEKSSEAELGTFMRRRISSGDGGKDYTLGKDIGVLCWAMGRWVEISIRRARFWCTVHAEVGTPESRKQSIERTLTKKKRKRATAVDGGIAADLDETEESRKLKWTRKDLLPNMGRTAMHIMDEGKGVQIMFEWRLEFDWTGEVESQISASASYPESWQEDDERKSLARVPETFDRMVKEKGPLGAVRSLVGLLMPPGR